jgi:hypothetical protein
MITQGAASSSGLAGSKNSSLHVAQLSPKGLVAFGAAVDARILAVVKIAHVQDEGSSGHDLAAGAFRDLGKRPIGRLAARLDLPIE